MHLKERMKIELQRDISQISLQIIYCILFAGVVQVVYRLFAGYLQQVIHTLTFSMPFPLNFCNRPEAEQLTDKPSYRDVWTHQKSKLRRGGYIFFSISFLFVFFLFFFLVSGSSEKNCLGGFFTCSKSIT